MNRVTVLLAIYGLLILILGDLIGDGVLLGAMLQMAGNLLIALACCRLLIEGIKQRWP